MSWEYEHTKKFSQWDASVARSFQRNGFELTDEDKDLVRLVDGNNFGDADRLVAAISPNLYLPNPQDALNRGPSILDFAQITNRGGSDWFHRILYRNMPCAKAKTEIDCPEFDPTFVEGNSEDCGRDVPKTVIMPFRITYCHTASSGSFGDVSELMNEALLGLAQSRASSVASMLFTGRTSQGARPGYVNGDGVYVPNPYVTMLSGGLPVASVIDAGGPVSPYGAVSRLSSAMSCCMGPNRTGIILTPPGTFESLPQQEFYVEGRGWRTKLGHGVAPDCGFDGRAPGVNSVPSSAAATTNLYGIGGVSVLFGRPFVEQALAPSNGRSDTVTIGGVTVPASAFDPLTNSVRFTAVQQAAVAFDRCCIFTVESKNGVCNG